MFGGLTHRPAVTLAELLVATTPASLTKVFLADSGSVSVEVALKMALQYQRGVRGIDGTRKTQFMALRSGYHGDTMGAMSVCDAINGMHAAFASNLMTNRFLPRPPCDVRYSLLSAASRGKDDVVDGGCYGCSCHRSCGTKAPASSSSYEEALEDACVVMEQMLEQHGETTAAVIVEPLVQGAGGMRFYDPRYLQRLRAACTVHDVLLICDEIATGFARSATTKHNENDSDAHNNNSNKGLPLFASQEAGIEPDST